MLIDLLNDDVKVMLNRFLQNHPKLIYTVELINIFVYIRMLKKLRTFIVIVVISTLLSYAVGSQSRQSNGIPILWILVAYSLILQIIAFVPASIFDTQKFYDLTGAITSITITAFTIFTNPQPNLRQYLSALLIGSWAFRLGSFLFLRIMKKGSDSRFVEIRQNKLRFFYAWLLQGLWVVITICPLLVILTKQGSKDAGGNLGLIEIIGLAVWITGFVFEIVADEQKSKFNENPENKGKFMRSGLWSISRHPNYVGEISLWLGAAIFAYSSLKGTQLFALISPVFIYFLLTKISGLPLLEKKAQSIWGKDQAYLEYKQTTPILFPFVGVGKQDIKNN